MKQTETFHMLSDETRLRALMLMDREGQICVCELVHALELSQPKISRHMAALRDSGLVNANRQAQWIFYSIDPDLPDWQRQVLSGAFAGLANEAVVRKDAHRLKNMKDRPLKAAA